MRRRTLKEIMEVAENLDEKTVGTIVRELYTIPMSQLYEQEYRRNGEQNLKLLEDLRIPVECAQILTLGDIACVIYEYHMNQKKGYTPGYTLSRLCFLDVGF